MKIYPRKIEIRNGDEEFHFKIRNSSEEDYLLLFKVRRSEPRLVIFTPKSGIVEPGLTLSINARLATRNITFAGLLVKLVAIHRSKLTPDFEESWRIGQESGVIKKTIQVKNNEFASFSKGDLDASFSIDNGDFGSVRDDDNDNDELTAVSVSDISGSDMKSSEFIPGAKFHRMQRSPRGGSATPYSRLESPRGQPLERQSTSSPQLDAVFKQIAALSTNQDSVETRSMLVGVGVALGANMLASTFPSAGQKKVSPSSNRQSPPTQSAKYRSPIAPALSSMLEKSGSPQTPYVSSSAPARGDLQGRGSSPITHALEIIQEKEAALQQILKSGPASKMPSERGQNSDAPRQEGVNNNPTSQSKLLPAATDDDNLSEDDIDPESDFFVTQIGASVQKSPTTRSGGNPNSPQRTKPSDFTGNGYFFESTPNVSAKLEAAQWSRVVDGDPSANQGSRNSKVVEIKGSSVTDSICKDALEMRCSDILNSNGYVAGIEICSCPQLNSFKSSVGAAFNAATSYSFKEGFAVESALAKARAAAVELSLQRLVVKHTVLSTLDESINRFQQLKQLELNNNRLTSFPINLSLPKLISLNLSGNQLTSLHGLQLLTSLQTLSVAHNHLVGFGSSINLLVPLANSITDFDCSFNKISRDPKYAEFVMTIFKNIKVFDGRTIRTVVAGYSSNLDSNSGPSVSSSIQPVVFTASTQFGMAPPLPIDLVDSADWNEPSSTGDPTLSQRRKELELVPSVSGISSVDSVHMLYNSEREAARLRELAVLHSERGKMTRKAPTPSRAAHNPVLETSLDSQIRRVYKRQQQQKQIQADKQARATRTSHDSEYRYPTSTSGTASSQRNQPPKTLIRSRSASTSGREQEWNRMNELSQGFAPRSQPVEAIRSSIDQLDEAIRLEENTLNYTLPTGTSAPTRTSTSPPPPAYSQNRQPSFSALAQANGNGDKSVGRDDGANRSPSPHSEVSTVSRLSGSKASSTRRLSAEANVLRPTASTQRRRQSFGMGLAEDSSIAGSADDLSVAGGYNSDVSANQGSKTGRNSVLNRKRMIVESSRRSPAVLREMQEDPKYAIWNSRYRIPQPVFGFSKPFAHRPLDESKIRPASEIPLFYETIHKMRDNFEKLPPRGTIARASKGLPPQFYPMDHDDVEALRRSGHFNDAIGITHGHVDDLYDSQPDGKSQTPSSALSTHSPHRRRTLGKHHGRQYKVLDEVLEKGLFQPEDNFSSYKKWHPTLYQDNVLDHSELNNFGIRSSNSTIDSSIRHSSTRARSASPKSIRHPIAGSRSVESGRPQPETRPSSGSKLKTSDLQSRALAELSVDPAYDDYSNYGGDPNVGSSYEGIRPRNSTEFSEDIGTGPTLWSLAYQRGTLTPPSDANPNRRSLQGTSVPEHGMAVRTSNDSNLSRIWSLANESMTDGVHDLESSALEVSGIGRQQIQPNLSASFPAREATSNNSSFQMAGVPTSQLPEAANPGARPNNQPPKSQAQPFIASASARRMAEQEQIVVQEEEQLAAYLSWLETQQQRPAANQPKSSFPDQSEPQQQFSGHHFGSESPIASDSRGASPKHRQFESAPNDFQTNSWRGGTNPVIGNLLSDRSGSARQQLSMRTSHTTESNPFQRLF